MTSTGRRALHYVIKTGNRYQSWHFFHRILGMQILRHEEFDEGCKATCNGPYDGKWSKTMIGFGNEDENFVIEMTYNYGVSSYKRGNDYQFITVQSCGGIMERVREGKFQYIQKDDKTYILVSPCGYTFHILEEDKGSKTATDVPQVTKVALSCTNLERTKAYYTEKLNMTLYEEGADFIVVGFEPSQAKVEMRKINPPLNRESAFGRTAFSCPRSQLPGIEAAIKDSGNTILTPLVSLDTPGKATVEVVILGDLDGHEICFVGDEAFRELSQVDPSASEKLMEALAADKSDDWFKKTGRSKEER